MSKLAYFLITLLYIIPTIGHAFSVLDMPILDKTGIGFELAVLLLKNECSYTIDLLKRILKKCRHNPKFVFCALAAVKDKKAIKKLHMESIVDKQVDSLLDIVLQMPHPDWLLQNRECIAMLLDLCLSESKFL